MLRWLSNPARCSKFPPIRKHTIKSTAKLEFLRQLGTRRTGVENLMIPFRNNRAVGHHRFRHSLPLRRRRDGPGQDPRAIRMNYETDSKRRQLRHNDKQLCTVPCVVGLLEGFQGCRPTPIWIPALRPMAFAPSASGIPKARYVSRTAEP